MKDLSKAVLWLNRISNKLPYGGLLLVAFLVIQAQTAASISEHTLRDSVRRQQTLRNLLWTNLIVQRSAVLKLTGKVKKVPNFDTSSSDMMKSLPSVLSERPFENLKNEDRLLTDIEEVTRVLETNVNVDQLIDKVEVVGAELNASESEEWYGLVEHNERLLNEMEKRGLYASMIDGLFAFYLLFLGWVMSRTKKAELSRDIAEKANNAKSTFLANMSHELRTPMHGILSFARFGMRDSTNPAKQNDLHSYFSEINDSGSRLMQLLNDLLDLAKLEAKKMNYSIDRLDMVTLVERVVTEMRAYATEKKISITFEKPLSEFLVDMDEGRIAQVVRNILSNAINYSFSDTEVKIKLAFDGKYVECSVENVGKGIPKNELSSIFDKFVQSSKTRTGAGGTGLGLAICREIIEQHHGKIWAESELDQLTTFKIKIPIKSVREEYIAA